eukprot:GFUD01015174.1.p1 GENE.GFUD01015174.1~~GFUD01015174.1.p1  ORF type:complete len:732 (-),score=178.17 GFUD01015174.1:172-2367(-)
MSDPLRSPLSEHQTPASLAMRSPVKVTSSYGKVTAVEKEDLMYEDCPRLEEVMTRDPDKYCFIAKLDDQLEDVKWEERTTVITSMDHQDFLAAASQIVQNIMDTAVTESETESSVDTSFSSAVRLGDSDSEYESAVESVGAITAEELVDAASLFLEDLEYEVPGTPCIPSTKTSSSSRASDDPGEEGFRFRMKEADPETPNRAFGEERGSEITACDANSTNVDTPNLIQNLDSCVNSTQHLNISRELSMLDQDKFLLEPISPIVSVEPKSPTIPIQQISPVPSPSGISECLQLVSVSKDDIQHPFTVIKDASPDFRHPKPSQEGLSAETDRPITPVSATNSTFITEHPIQATNSTFNNSPLHYRQPRKQDESNLDLFQEEPPSREISLKTDIKVDQVDPFPAVQVPIVSTPTLPQTILGKKTHRLVKKVNFTDNSEVFYFPRSQGWVSVPKEGGNTLGMGAKHFHTEMVPMLDQENWNNSNLTESYVDNESGRALRPRKSARLSICSTVSTKQKKFLDTEDLSKKSPETEPECKEWKSTIKKPGVIKLTRVSESKSLPIISENEDHSFIEKSPEPIKSTRKNKNNRSFQVTPIFDSTLDSTADYSMLNATKSSRTGELGTRGLDRISSRKRKVILKTSGVENLDAREAEELKIIRENRDRVGCDCKGACNPALCSCAGEGIQCHQERAGSPCQCREGECGNPAGRYKFEPTAVQMHFIQTIMETQGAFSIN